MNASKSINIKIAIILTAKINRIILKEIFASISYIKIGHILSQNVKYGIFVANVTKTEHMRYEEISLGRILCEEAPQVVTAWLSLTSDTKT